MTPIWLKLNQFKDYINSEKEKYSKLAFDRRIHISTRLAYQDFIFILNDVLRFVEELEKEYMEKKVEKSGEFS